MNRRRWTWVSGAALCVVAMFAACSEDSETSVGAPGGPGAGGGAANGGAGGQGGGFGGSNVECTDDGDCNGGVCLNGVCCGSADLVCADVCCDSGDVCLFEECVTPGDDCTSSADCPEGWYCEPALGDGGQGGQGANCTQPIVTGKCLPLPEICGEGGAGGNGGSGGDCIEPCEYHPPVGQLSATRKWQWGYDPVPVEFPNKADVWSTPTVARMFDANCDGEIDLADPPDVVFVSGNAQATCCHCTGNATSACRTGVLRMLDGQSGVEIWSLDMAEPNSVGFAGLSVALGDVDGDQLLDVVAITGEGKVAIIGHDGVPKQVSTDAVNGSGDTTFGWGGGVALGDMNNDGWTEIAYGRSVFTMAGGTLALLFHGAEGAGGIAYRRVTHFADLDGDGDLELVAGRTAYRYDGSMLWNNAAFDGFTATGDFDGDQLPEVVEVDAGQMRILEGVTGITELGPVDIPGAGSGGPPTVADFDGDGQPEIGVAMQNFYSVMKPNYATMTIDVVWSQVNHDLSSSVTGSSVFDFEGDGKAEVVYMDECFVWVYDGSNGNVLYAALSQSFTATEASIVADVDGDGHAEMVVVHNGADPSANGWGCNVAPWNQPDPALNRPAWVPPPNAAAYRGITVLADAASSWVGTRTLWNQHAYNVSNVCDPRDSACSMGSYYGQIPTNQIANWSLPWLNNFRQNVQEEGLFDAPDVTLKLDALCTTPVEMEIQVRNMGLAGLPSGIEIGIFEIGNPDALLDSVFTTKALLPGQTEIIAYTAPAIATTADTFEARVIIDPMNPTFHECKDDNNTSGHVTPMCVQ
jgi:VCBS repeat protein